MDFLPDRRAFLGTSLVAVATASSASPTSGRNKVTPTIHTRDEVIIGEGEFQFKVDHTWCKLPEKYRWQTTHNVAVDSQNNLYVIHEGERDLKDHPSIFVFDAVGQFIKAFGCQFQGGGHGIEIRKEGNEEFIYVAAYQQVKAFSKLTLEGETVWFRKAPMESGVYDEGESISTKPSWNRKGFLPTNFAFLHDGGFLLADGYGSFHIHRFDADANWVSHFGGPGEGEGLFNTAHGLWIDDRPGRTPSIVVTDRAHNTLQYFDMDGKYVETIEGFGLPANIDVQGNLMLVSELNACVTLMNEENEMVARLGKPKARTEEVKNLRVTPDKWIDGEFIHPHDACFDREGNIFVAEWVNPGRVTKLTRAS